jgi:DNA repair exonuclease SbcCD ATPase subunit
MIESLNSALGISSPSKEGEKAGKFLVEGLVVGMTKNFRLIERTLENLIPLMRQALGEGAADQAKSFLRDLETMDKRFEKLKTRIGNFRSAIRGAFVDASDLIGTIGAALEQFRSDQEQFLKDQASFTGAEGQLAPVAPQSPDLQALVAAQVAQAQQLAKLLKQLQGQGLSTANLAQIAGQGAGGIPIAEALLADPALIAQLNDAQQAIADITQQTADKLTAAAFGDKVERMGTELDDLLSELQKFKRGLQVPALTDETSEFIRQLQRLNDALASLGIGPGGGSGNTGAAVRDALLTLKRRNVTTGL